MMKMKWVQSGKRSSEKLLQELGWFVDKLHELVLTRDTKGNHYIKIHGD
jgi:hypothetical protein